MKRIITNDEYLKEMSRCIAEINKMKKEAISLTADIISDTLYEEDFFFSSAVDRSVALMEGMKVMLEIRNLTCIGVILRAQIDNCMRLFAVYIAADKNDLIKNFIEGNPINKLKDNLGRKMTDALLKERLSEYDPTIKAVYENASGHVHLSDKALYSSIAGISTEKDENAYIEVSVGLPLKESANAILIEAAEAFIHFLHLQYKLLMPVAKSKKVLECNNL